MLAAARYGISGDGVDRRNLRIVHPLPVVGPRIVSNHLHCGAEGVKTVHIVERHIVVAVGGMGDVASGYALREADTVENGVGRRAARVLEIREAEFQSERVALVGVEEQAGHHVAEMEFVGVDFRVSAVMSAVGIIVVLFHIAYHFRIIVPLSVEIERPFAFLHIQRRRRRHIRHILSGSGSHSHIAHHAVGTVTLHRDFYNSRCRVGGIFRSAQRYDLDFAHVLSLERLKECLKLVVVHLQLAVVDVDFRIAPSVDGNLVVVNPHTRSVAQYLRAVLAYGGGHILHHHHEAVGLAAYG